MKSKSVIFSIVMILAVIACEEKDAPVLEGDIHGTVSLIDGYGYSLTDNSGVKVQLTGVETELETETDRDGRYIFQDLPFGNYQIKLIRENYVEKNWNVSFGHAGGDAPTAISLVMNEIPEYYYGIDSMTYESPYFVFYMHIFGAGKTFGNSAFCVQFFFSQSLYVSCDNYDYSFIERRWTYEDGFLSYWYHSNFLDGYTGTIYCRVYPQTIFDLVWENYDILSPQVYPETLGPPSEVFSFTVEGITRTNPDL
jgi:hypothetical protein